MRQKRSRRRLTPEQTTDTKPVWDLWKAHRIRASRAVGVVGLTVLTLALASGIFAADGPVLIDAELLGTFSTLDARQGVAVGAEHFYAVGNVRITKHRKADGEALVQWDGGPEGSGPLIHLDSGTVYDGKLYAAHSNYPHWPITSSVEVWAASSMEHVASYSFGIALGSFTWLDHHDGSWWGAFANYDKVQKGQASAYGHTSNTQVVRMNDRFQVMERWTLPRPVLDRMAPMSNSGGSWGPDGLLYLTGHDRPEIYVLKLPEMGSTLHWVATVRASWIEGQGLAWDRSTDERILWGILKRERQVVRLRIPPIPIDAQNHRDGRLLTPGSFRRD